MDIQTATTGLLDAQANLQSKRGTDDPNFMSEQMARLANYTVSVETYLAELEREYESQQSARYRQLLKTQSSTRAENESKAEFAELRGDIKYFGRIVASAWKQVGMIQSRYNHINKEIAGQI